MFQSKSANQISNKINQILNNLDLSITHKIEQLIGLFSQETTINLEDFKMIDKLLKGSYGSEYLIIQKNMKDTMNFYYFLGNKFPESELIKLSLADLLLLNNQYYKSFNLFNQVFTDNPLLIFKAPGELYKILEKYGNDEHKIIYRLSLVRAFFEDKNPEDALEEYQETIEEYGINNQIIKNYLKITNLLSFLDK